MLHIVAVGAILAVPNLAGAHTLVSSQVKKALVDKFLSLRGASEKVDLLKKNPKIEAHHRELQMGCRPDDVFCQLAALCDVYSAGAFDQVDMGPEISQSDTGLLMDCICSDSFDSDTLNAFLEQGAADDLGPVCTNQCIPAMEMLFSGEDRRQLQEEPEPQALQGRLLEASPSPDFSPSPSPDDADIDPFDYFLCACEIPEVQGLVMGGRAPNDDEIAMICSASECHDLIYDASGGTISCPDNSVEYTVTLTVNAAGSVEDYTEDVIDDMKPEFATLMEVPVSAVSISVTSASVNIAVTVTMPTVQDALDVQSIMQVIEDDPSTLEATLSGITLADGSSLSVNTISTGEVLEVDLASKVESDNKKDFKLAVEAIVGIAVGSVFVVVAMMTICVCCCCCKKKEVPAAAAKPVPVTMNVVSAAADGEGKV